MNFGVERRLLTPCDTAWPLRPSVTRTSRWSVRRAVLTERALWVSPANPRSSTAAAKHAGTCSLFRSVMIRLRRTSPARAHNRGDQRRRGGLARPGCTAVFRTCCTAGPRSHAKPSCFTTSLWHAGPLRGPTIPARTVTTSVEERSGYTVSAISSLADTSPWPPHPTRIRQ